MRTAAHKLHRDLRLLLRLNWPVNIATVLLLVFGVLFIYSACFISAEQEVQSYYKKQMVWAIPGLGAYLFFALFDYRRLRKLALSGYVVSLLLLVLVMIMGESRHGSQRWLQIGGASGILLQPSELMKLATLVFLARFFSKPEVDYRSPGAFWSAVGIAALPFLMIVKQPDLGTAMVFIPLSFAMMFVAGVPLKYLGTVVLTGVAIITLVISIFVVPQKLGMDQEKQEKVISATGLKPHQVKRIMVFLNLDQDPHGSGWNKRQSQIAVGSGGFWGKGYTKGTQNILGFLPRSVAPTDFIYSVIAEEKGFFGSIVLLVLYGTIIAGGVLSALVAKDKMGRLLCVGVVVMIFSHVFINIAMTVGLMPITGLPLPLLSYGGTFMIVIMSALGIVQSVYIRSQRIGVFEHSERPIRYSG